MNQKMKNTLAVVLAAIMLLTSAVLFTGCGSTETKPTTATAPATTATTAPATEKVDTDQTQDADQNDTDDEDDGTDENYIDRQTAIATVRQQAGTGAQVLDCYKGYTPDGDYAWVVTVAPISTSDDAENDVYYVNESFCYKITEEKVEEDDDDAEMYIDKADAIAAVKQQAGTGAQILDCYKGYAPEGYRAWVITVAPITTGEGPDTVTYYCNFNFCYPEG